MQVPEVGGGYGGGAGGSRGDGHGSRSLEFDNPGEGLTWRNYTIEDHNAIMHECRMLVEREDMEMGDHDALQAQELGPNNGSIGLWFPPISTARAISLQNYPASASPGNFQFGTAVANEIVAPTSIPTGFNNAAATFSQTDIAEDPDFSEPVADQLYPLNYLDLPLSYQGCFVDTRAAPDACREAEFESTIPNDELSEAVFGRNPRPHTFAPRCDAPGLLAQPAVAGRSARQDQSRQQQSGQAPAGEFRTQIQPSVLNNQSHTSTPSAAGSQLPENQQGPVHANTFGFARCLYPLFFSNPNQGDDGLFGW